VYLKSKAFFQSRGTDTADSPHGFGRHVIPAGIEPRRNSWHFAHDIT